jgi:hypothetical protein
VQAVPASANPRVHSTTTLRVGRWVDISQAGIGSYEYVAVLPHRVIAAHIDPIGAVGMHVCLLLPYASGLRARPNVHNSEK